MAGQDDSNYYPGSKEDSCYFCGSGPPLEEHHVIPQRFGGPNSRGNIVELCQLCHQRLERLYDKSFYEWFGIEDQAGERKFHRQCGWPECSNQAVVYIWSPEYRQNVHRCRPCAAKIARKEYERQIRQLRKGGLVKGEPETEKPDQDEIFEELVIERADDF